MKHENTATFTDFIPYGMDHTSHTVKFSLNAMRSDLPAQLNYLVHDVN